MTPEEQLARVVEIRRSRFESLKSWLNIIGEGAFSYPPQKFSHPQRRRKKWAYETFKARVADWNKEISQGLFAGAQLDAGSFLRWRNQLKVFEVSINLLAREAGLSPGNDSEPDPARPIPTRPRIRLPGEGYIHSPARDQSLPLRQRASDHVEVPLVLWDLVDANNCGDDRFLSNFLEDAIGVQATDARLRRLRRIVDGPDFLEIISDIDPLGALRFRFKLLSTPDGPKRLRALRAWVHLISARRQEEPTPAAETDDEPIRRRSESRQYELDVAKREAEAESTEWDEHLAARVEGGGGDSAHEGNFFGVDAKYYRLQMGHLKPSSDGSPAPSNNGRECDPEDLLDAARKATSDPDVLAFLEHIHLNGEAPEEAMASLGWTQERFTEASSAYAAAVPAIRAVLPTYLPHDVQGTSIDTRERTVATSLRKGSQTVRQDILNSPDVGRWHPPLRAQEWSHRIPACLAWPPPAVSPWRPDLNSMLNSYPRLWWVEPRFLEGNEQDVTRRRPQSWMEPSPAPNGITEAQRKACMLIDIGSCRYDYYSAKCGRQIESVNEMTPSECQRAVADFDPLTYRAIAKDWVASRPDREDDRPNDKHQRFRLICQGEAQRQPLKDDALLARAIRYAGKTIRNLSELTSGETEGLIAELGGNRPPAERKSSWPPRRKVDEGKTYHPAAGYEFGRHTTICRVELSKAGEYVAPGWPPERLVAIWKSMLHKRARIDRPHAWAALQQNPLGGNQVVPHAEWQTGPTPRADVPAGYRFVWSGGMRRWALQKIMPTG